MSQSGSPPKCTQVQPSTCSAPEAWGHPPPMLVLDPEDRQREGEARGGRTGWRPPGPEMGDAAPGGVGGRGAEKRSGQRGGWEGALGGEGARLAKEGEQGSCGQRGRRKAGDLGGRSWRTGNGRQGAGPNPGGSWESLKAGEQRDGVGGAQPQGAPSGGARRPAGGGRAEARKQERGLRGSSRRREGAPDALFPPGTPELGNPLNPPPPPRCSVSSPPLQGPLFPQRCPLPPLCPASHTLCVRSSSGTPREGPTGGTGGSGGPGGSLGSRGRRRKLYSAVPGRSFMAVKSYQAQAEGEISLSKGEKIKGKGQAPERTTQGGAVRATVLECSAHSGGL